MTANVLTFHHASLFPRWEIDFFIWLPQNYGTIFPFLLEIYLQLMLLKRLVNQNSFVEFNFYSFY